MNILNTIGLLPILMAGSIVVVSWYKCRKIHANDIASLATTAGIFFTFLGIVMALFGLANPDKTASVDEKIDELLEGIFVAFIPSIFGAGIAVSTHVWPDYWRKPVEEDDEQETDIDAQVLQELKRLNTNLVGDGETSLTTRLQKFQLQVTEKQDELRKEFQLFAKNVADNIIEALKKSMADLNKKLGEQFGENFRRFADVIPKLLEWQENYQKTIDNTQQQLKTQSDHLGQLLESLGSADKSFTSIAEHTGTIATASTRIDDFMQAVHNSFDQIFKGVREMRADAEQFQIATQSLTENIAKQTESAVSQTTALEKSAKSLTGIAEKTGDLSAVAKELDRHIQTINTALGGVDRLANALQGRAESIENDMRKLTTETIKELAGNLQGISKVLVDDYRAVQKAIEQIRRQQGGR